MYSNYYNVEELYKNLNIYSDDLTGKDIVDLFITYDLKQYLKPSDTKQEIFNNDNRRIYFGDTFIPKMNITHVNMIATDLGKTGEDGINLAGQTTLVNNIYPTHRITINIGKRSNEPTRVMDLFTKIRLEPNFLKDEVFKGIEELKESNKKLYDLIIEGKGVLEIDVKVNEATLNLIGHDVMQAQLYNRFYRIVKDLLPPQVTVSLIPFGGSVLFSTYMWARDTVEIGKKCYTELVKTDSLNDKAKKDKVMRRVLTEELGIEKGKVCLFSIGRFLDTAMRLGVLTQNIQLDPKSRAILDKWDENGDYTTRMVINSTSFAKSYIRDITNEYLWISVGYGSAGGESTRCLPIKWSMLVPPMKDYVTGEGGGKHASTIMDNEQGNKHASINSIYNLIENTMVLLTNKNSISLRHPTEMARLGIDDAKLIS